jgi:aldehyde:ferredoxin oxidoreductase
MGSTALNGYNGRILRINLSDGQITSDYPPEDYYQRYLGGRGFIVTTLLKETPAQVDPLGPQNRLIFALGTLTGMPLPGSGRSSVGAKSPLTGGYGESEAGGFVGAELKKAGFDALIIEGKAASPVYLWIQDGQAELRDAGHLWGMEVAQTHFEIQKELADRLIRTAIIGSGGERLVRFASIAHDINHIAGRTGMGAVMGSKNLKAVAVRGRATPSMSDPRTIHDLSHWMAKNFKEQTALWKFGTGNNMEGNNLVGNLPVLNFRDGFFDGAAKISAQAIREQFGVGMGSCYACPIRCKKKVKIDEPWAVDPIYGGPEYETLGAFGSNCGISDPRAVCKAHDICNRHGLDTISAGAAVSFTMECFERGLLTPHDTGGYAVNFGDGQAMVRLLEQIVRREGLGAILAEGTRRAAGLIGKGAEECTVQVKGLDLPMHDPRFKQGMGLHYSVHATGADHCTGVQDTQYIKGDLEGWKGIDVCEPIPSTELSPRKARLVYQNGLWKHLNNHLGLCYFVPYSHKQVRDAVEAVTGWPMSHWRLMKAAERGMSLARMFNLREGFSDADDRLPKRMSEPQRTGNLKGIAVDFANLEEMQRLYYQMLGWDERGVPTRARLVELDIEWAAAL